MSSSNIKLPVFRSPVVMLIDDQALVAHRVKDLLKNETDISFHYCSDPAIAISQAIQIHPTIILMDLVMPKIDGLTLCRVFRDNQDTADIPIIMLSSNDDGLTKAHSFNSGANDYLVKLPDQVEFIARIRYHSKSYIIKLERDEAYEALCQSQIELEAANARLQQMAHQDELTQLPNRPLFIDRLAMALAKAKRDQHSAAVLFLDLDNFKPINDTYGHQTGDEVLRIVARRLLSSVRETDTVARLGGDEFALVLGELNSPDYAATVAQKIINSISVPLQLTSTQQAALGISIGISNFPDDARELDRLLAYADHAMYASKRSGKNCYRFFKDLKGDSFAGDLWLEFKDEYLSGISILDQQHAQLIQLVNQLNIAVNHNEKQHVIINLFDQLLTKTQQHFATEEALLIEYTYPEAATHSEDHKALLNELIQLKTKFNQQGGDLLVLQHLKSWVLGHLLYGDQQATAFLIKHGA